MAYAAGHGKIVPTELGEDDFLGEYSAGDWGGWGRNLLLPSSVIRY